MQRIEPIPREDLAQYEEGFQVIETLAGFVPNSLFTMARVPGLVEGFTGLAQVVLFNDLLPADLHPNVVTDADIDECRRFYTDDQVTAIVAVCALYGYLNRWNETLATPLEDLPGETASRVLAPQGWAPGNHGGP